MNEETRLPHAKQDLQPSRGEGGEGEGEGEGAGAGERARGERGAGRGTLRFSLQLLHVPHGLIRVTVCVHGFQSRFSIPPRAVVRARVYMNWSRLSCPRWPVLDRVRDRGRNEDTHGVFRSFICNLKKITAGYTSGRAGSSTRMRGATGSATWRAPRRPSPRRRAWRSDHRPRSSRTLVARGGCCTWRTWRACLGGRGRMSAQPHPKGEVSSRLDRGTWAFLVRIAATHKPPRHARRSHSRRRAKRAADARPR